MNKKGQAAMEFLMTYGWAILAAVIVIGVLASFGVFSPGKFISASCLISSPFGCVDNQVSANTTTVSMVIRNGGGSTLNITNVSIGSCTSDGSSGYIGNIADQATQEIDILCGGLTADEKFSSGVTIKYRSSGGVLDRTSSGNIIVKVSST